MRSVYILAIFTCVTAVEGAFAQTKKIANASHNSAGPTFNWNSSDNLGEIMDYDKIRQFKVAIDTTIQVDSVSSDSVIVIQTITEDTASERELVCLPKDSVTDRSKVKEHKRLKKRKKVRRTEQKLEVEKGKLIEEIKQEDFAPVEIQYKADASMWFLLLLIPVGYLMIKRP